MAFLSALVFIASLTTSGTAGLQLYLQYNDDHPSSLCVYFLLSATRNKYCTRIIMNFILRLWTHRLYPVKYLGIRVYYTTSTLAGSDVLWFGNRYSSVSSKTKYLVFILVAITFHNEITCSDKMQYYSLSGNKCGSLIAAGG